MRVFLSWSGELSHKVALAFREWLPSVIQSIEPYVSSEDIDKGKRWSTEMAEELEKSRYGIICVTKENVNKPWINFEAGALSKSIEKSTVQPLPSAVSPFLFDLKSSDLEGPLTQFQYAVNESSDILKIIISINNRDATNQLSPDKLEKAFDRWWPDLRDAFAKISTEAPVTAEAKTPPRKQEEILDELLELVRGQQRLMMSKEDMSPLFNTLRTELLQALRPAFNVGFGTPFSTPSQLANLFSLDPATAFTTGKWEPTTNVASRTVNATESIKEQEKEKSKKDKPADTHKKLARPPRLDE